MATTNSNNWGGMSPSSSKLTTTKSLAQILKDKTAAKVAATPAPVPAPVDRSWASKFTQNVYANPSPTAFADYLNPPKDKATGLQVSSGLLDKLAQQSGIGVNFVPPLPSNANISRPGGGGGGAASTKSIYDYLNVDPTAIYAPMVKLIQDQKTAAEDRYKKNLGDISNIFSALTSVAPADKLRINEQFKNMLTAQQAALAARTTAAQDAATAGVAQGIASGAESGGGPAMALNPLQTATAEGIAGSNKLATVWSELQGANQAQALADVDARAAGYTAQRAAAVQGLQQSLQDRLAGIAGTEADVQSQLAQQKFNIASNIGQAKYNNALAAQRSAAAGTKAPSGLAGLQAKLGADGFSQLAAGANNAYSSAWAALNPVDATGAPVSKTVKAPTAANVKAAWIAAGGDPALLPEVSQYVTKIYG